MVWQAFIGWIFFLLHLSLVEESSFQGDTSNPVWKCEQRGTFSIAFGFIHSTCKQCKDIQHKDNTCGDCAVGYHKWWRILGQWEGNFPSNILVFSGRIMWEQKSYNSIAVPCMENTQGGETQQSGAVHLPHNWEHLSNEEDWAAPPFSKHNNNVNQYHPFPDHWHVLGDNNLYFLQPGLLSHSWWDTSCPGVATAHWSQWKKNCVQAICKIPISDPTEAELCLSSIFRATCPLCPFCRGFIINEFFHTFLISKEYLLNCTAF